MPRGIDFLLLGRCDFDGVEFHDVLKGGIEMPDPGAWRTWKNVVFGPGNFGKPDELFRKYDGPLDLKMKETGIAAEMLRNRRTAGQSEQ